MCVCRSVLCVFVPVCTTEIIDRISSDKSIKEEVEKVPVSNVRLILKILRGPCIPYKDKQLG